MAPHFFEKMKGETGKTLDRFGRAADRIFSMGSSSAFI